MFINMDIILIQKTTGKKFIILFRLINLYETLAISTIIDTIN